MPVIPTIRRGLPTAGLALIAAGCGGGLGQGQALKTSAQTCKVTVEKLKKRMGPEMGQVVQSAAVKISAQDDPACAVIYTLLGEEMMGEGLPMSEVPDPAMDHRLAVGSWSSQGQVTLHLVPASTESPGPVHLTLSTKDVDQDKLTDLVVQEDASTPGDTWQGLRLLSLSQLDQPPHELFSGPLMFKTAEGINLAGDWAAGQVSGRPALLMQFGQQKRIYSWDSVKRRFTFDELATNAQAQSTPAAPAAPATPKAAAPASDLSKELGL